MIIGDQLHRHCGPGAGCARAAFAALSALLTAACAPLPHAGPAAAPPVVAAADWGGEPAAPPAAALQAVTHLTVHHQGTFWPADGDVPAYLRRLQQWSRNSRGWVDLPYHYVIGPDGRIYAGRSPSLAGDSNTEYDTRGHLQVMLMGNFEQQSPTPPQWDSTVQLLAHLLRRHGLDADRIAAHRDHTAQTVCPGARLMARFDALRAGAAAQAGGPSGPWQHRALDTPRPDPMSPPSTLLQAD